MRGHAQVLLAHLGAERALDGGADDLGARLVSVLLRHDLERHLAGPEAGHLDRLRNLAQALLDFLVDLGHGHGHIESAFERIRGSAALLRFSLHGKSLKSYGVPAAGAVLRVVRRKGLEPLRLAALEPKSSASTNSATFARS
jgi:hypothetical protein